MPIRSGRHTKTTIVLYYIEDSNIRYNNVIHIHPFISSIYIIMYLLVDIVEHNSRIYTGQPAKPLVLQSESNRSLQPWSHLR